MSNTLSIYKASAGAGKTFRLTVEYILLLLRRGRKEYEHTLAVTFTNKATAEMKDRILETLYGLANGLSECDNYLDAIQKSLHELGEDMGEAMIRARASEALTSILHDYSHFRVETIDSFFQSVLRNLAHELGLSANMQVELNTKEVVSRAVDRVIENMHDSKDVQAWIMDYVEEQLQTGDTWQISNMVKKFAGCIFEEAYQNRSAEERMKISNSEEMNAFKAKMYSIINDGKKQIKDEAERFEKLVDSCALNFDKISKATYYTGFLNKVKAGTFDMPSNTVVKAANDGDVLLYAKDKNNEKLKEASLVVSAALRSFLALYNDLRLNIVTAQLCIKYLNPIRLLNVIEQEANYINAENNQFNLSKTPTLLSKLVEGSDAPFVFEKIGTQFHNVMIDEFQDTSRLQWNNFKVLLFENQATGGNDLLVGDIKQSIYRWRNGDWAILKNVKSELTKLAPEEKELKHNYRSKKVVIDFNNAYFPRAAAALDEIREESRFKIKDIYSDVKQLTNKTKDEGFVSVSLYMRHGNSAPIDYEKRMVTDMVDKVRDMMGKGLKINDFAILIRNKRYIAGLMYWFHILAPDIKLVSDEAFLLESSSVVQMIVAALQTLNDTKHLNPIPERYLMMHYRSEVLGKPLSMLEVAMLKPEDVLPEEFSMHKEELSELPLYLLCEKLYQIFQLEKIKEQDSYIFTFMDELQNHLHSNPSDIHTFLQAWEESIHGTAIPGGEVNGIRIITIHKSKGLQYHTVLLPYMDWGVEKNVVSDETIWCKSDIKPYDGLGSLPINSDSKMKESYFSDDFEEEHLQRRVDSLNTIYVAFTRAESNLLVWGQTSEKGINISSAGDLIRKGLDMENVEEDLLHYEVGTPYTQRKKKDEETQNRLKFTHEDKDAIDIRMSSNPPTLDFMQSNQSKKFISSLSSEVPEEVHPANSYLEIGKVMHYVLSQIEHEGEIQKVLNRSMSEGLISDHKMMENVVNRIKAGFRNKKIAGWFAEDNEVFNECSITSIDPKTNEPHTLRPDRVIIKDAKITVIDFKFGRPDEEYHTQVRQYMNLLRSMYPEMEVEGYLWYIYSGKTEEVKG